MLRVHRWCYDTRGAPWNLRRLWCAEKRRIVRKSYNISMKPRMPEWLLKLQSQKIGCYSLFMLYFHSHHKLIDIYIWCLSSASTVGCWRCRLASALIRIKQRQKANTESLTLTWIRKFASKPCKKHDIGLFRSPGNDNHLSQTVQSLIPNVVQYNIIQQ